MTSLEGATLTITGGSGSFAATMVRYLLRRGVGCVKILSRDKAKQDEMRKQFSHFRLRFFVGGVRDMDSVAGALLDTDFAFHAAALKQVLSCEFFPDQAVKTNVVGSRNVIEAAATAGVLSVVCLSTDKGVYPVNAIGMSKALMEKTAQAFARNHPKSAMTVSITRYGNVMYSLGSVLPLLVEQLQAGRPPTVTEPRMIPFLMSLQESVELVELVEYTFLHAEPGGRFVRKAPAATIDVLAREVAGLLGQDEPDVKVIGTRRGEKLHETLLSREEMVKATDLVHYFRLPLDARSLQYELYFEEGKKDVPYYEDYTSENTERLDVDRTRALLTKLTEVPQLLGLDTHGHGISARCESETLSIHRSHNGEEAIA